jgi:sideroflexin-5
MTELNELIDLTKPRYDQSTYIGRLRHFIEVTSPLTLFTTEKKLNSSISLLKDYKEGKLTRKISSNELYDALRSIFFLNLSKASNCSSRN